MNRSTLFAVMGLTAIVGCESEILPPPQPPFVSTDTELRQNLTNWGVVPIGPMPVQNSAKVALGQALFFDKILSGNRDISCSTCHDPETSLGDGLSLSIGTGGTGRGPNRTLGPERPFVPRNAPSLLNAGLGLFSMFWDARLSMSFPGRFLNQLDSVLVNAPNILAAQAMLPVLNRVEMRGDSGDADVFGNHNELADYADGQQEDIWRAVMNRVTAIPEYVRMFDAAFPGTPRAQLHFRHAAEAMAAFQMESFTKTDSPFDRYLDRDDDALSTQEKRGALLFTGDAQCVTCHNGPFLGVQGLANVGAPQIGPGIGTAKPLDLGRGDIDGFEFYRFAFRVAPLRNVELTAPYMHSGAYASLDAVIEHYNDVQTALRSYDVSQLAPSLRDSYHGDFSAINAITATLDHRLHRPLNLSEEDKNDLLAFLKSLTDPAARNLASLIPDRVPSGLPLQ